MENNPKALQEAKNILENLKTDRKSVLFSDYVKKAKKLTGQHYIVLMDPFSLSTQTWPA